MGQKVNLYLIGDRYIHTYIHEPFKSEYIHIAALFSFGLTLVVI